MRHSRSTASGLYIIRRHGDSTIPDIHREGVRLENNMKPAAVRRSEDGYPRNSPAQSERGRRENSHQITISLKTLE